jgi:hypothetical protein
VDPVMGGEFGNVVAGNYYLKFVYADIGHPRTWTDQMQFTISAIPEPSSLAMSAAGLLLVLGRLRSQRRPT